MTTTMTTCPNCGKRFTPWRQKAYCSERCRKAAQNVRLGYVRRDAATYIADRQKTDLQVIDPIREFLPFRRDEGFEWMACNEVTQRLTCAGSRDAVGWAMLIEGHGWFGRIGVGVLGREFSFGPTSLPRARRVVEARLMGQDFAKLEGERSWSGDCASFLVGPQAARGLRPPPPPA